MSPLHDPTDWPATSAYKWHYRHALEELKRVEEIKDAFFFDHGGKTAVNREKLLMDVKYARAKAAAAEARELCALYAGAVQIDLLVTLIAATRSLAAARDHAPAAA